MDIEVIDENLVSLTATKKQWAQLGMILDWVMDDGDSMDGAIINMEQKEVLAALREWEKSANLALTQK